MTQEYGDYSFKTELEAAQGYTVPAAAEVSIPQDPFQKMHDDMQKAFLQGGTLDQILEAGGTAEPEDTKKSNLVEIFNSDKPRAFQLIIAKNGGASQEITAFVLAHEGTINVDKDFHLSMQKESLPPDEQALIGERTDLFSETPISPASLTESPKTQVPIYTTADIPPGSTSKGLSEYNATKASILEAATAEKELEADKAKALPAATVTTGTLTQPDASVIKDAEIEKELAIKKALQTALEMVKDIKLS